MRLRQPHHLLGVLDTQRKRLVHKGRHAGFQVRPRQLQVRVAGVFEHQHPVGFAYGGSGVVQHGLQPMLGHELLRRRAVAVPKHGNTGDAVETFAVGVLYIDELRKRTGVLGAEPYDGKFEHRRLPFTRLP